MKRKMLHMRVQYKWSEQKEKKLDRATDTAVLRRGGVHDG